MRPGYYIVVRALKLTKPPYRVVLRKGDWLVTDGEVLGRFDKEISLDWSIVEWLRGDPLLTQDYQVSLDSAVFPVQYQKLDAAFQKEMAVELGEDSAPSLPKPSLNQLKAILKARLASYDRR